MNLLAVAASWCVTGVSTRVRTTVWLSVRNALPEVRVNVRRLDPELPLPRYARDGDAGVDLCARVDTVLEPGARFLMPTGLAIAVPRGFVGLVHPRSGLAIRHGVTVVNAPGTIDAGYTGQVCVPLINVDRSEAFTITRGDRIAQLVLQEVASIVWNEVDELDSTERGESGFGASGGFGERRD
ncbi:dUTP diphosphatase [Dermatophilus congolensis]|nr:dUTP diphosphatase [Dermatophilus congolensis]MBO3151969.1 dUTP diphosphatase [Dermatophilus congolensis]MBO3161023.1 dUTP diphosphatase [Dermatophilus congolensis]MBO3163253.1 dUTP diphosphatase [Dermatophilus congolensis]MBO3176810.1 dUTP diphosphatase [Dermatophilus congolensis]